MFNAFNLYHQRLAITQETSDALDVYLYHGGVVYFSRNDKFICKDWDNQTYILCQKILF